MIYFFMFYAKGVSHVDPGTKKTSVQIRTCEDGTLKFQQTDPSITEPEALTGTVPP